MAVERRHHQQLRNPSLEAAADAIRLQRRLVQQLVRKPRHPPQTARGLAEQVGELRRVLPPPRALVQHHRHDGPQLRPPRFVTALGLPDAAAVAQQPQAEPPVRRRLVLEQKVHRNRLSGRGVQDPIQQVGLALEQLLVQEGPIDRGERRPLEALRDGIG